MRQRSLPVGDEPCRRVSAPPAACRDAVAAALRQEPTTAAARLIAISGYGQEEDRRRGQTAGFDAHLVKPVDFAALEKLLTGTASGGR